MLNENRSCDCCALAKAKDPIEGPFFRYQLGNEFVRLEDIIWMGYFKIAVVRAGKVTLDSY
jgi:hypothetical protein